MELKKSLLPPDQASALGALEARARALGKQAITSASRAGDLDHYLDENEGLDPRDLVASYWKEGPYGDELREAYDALAPELKAGLDRDLVMQRLLRIFDAQWNWFDRADRPEEPQD